MQHASHDSERRRFLKLAGTAPLALTAGAAWLMACGESEPRDPYASRTGDAAGGGASGATEEATAAGSSGSSGAQTTPDDGPKDTPDDSPDGGAETSPSDPSTALVTEVAAMQATVEALQYTNQSTKPDQRCEGCQFYTPTGDSRGSCQLFSQGKVSASGWCTSWAKKLDA